MKPTVGAQDTAGMYKLSEFYDAPGPMAKCTADVLDMTELLLGRPLRSPAAGNWEGLRVAYLDPTEWSMAEEMCEQFEGTAEQMVSQLPHCEPIDDRYRITARYLRSIYFTG